MHVGHTTCFMHIIDRVVFVLEEVLFIAVVAVRAGTCHMVPVPSLTSFQRSIQSLMHILRDQPRICDFRLLLVCQSSALLAMSLSLSCVDHMQQRSITSLQTVSTPLYGGGLVLVV